MIPRASGHSGKPSQHQPRPAVRSRQRCASRTAFTLALATGLSIGLATGRADAQPTDPLDITGQDFSGITLPMAPSLAPMEMRAQRVWSWQGPGGFLPDGAPAPRLQRMLLVGDVAVNIGGYRFRAARASVWIEPRPSRDGQPTVYQVFFLFDRVSSPGTGPSAGIAADRLPVEAVIAPPEGVQLAADLLRNERPTDPADQAFLIESEREFAGRLREIVGLPRIVPRESQAPGVRRPITTDDRFRPGIDRSFTPGSELVSEQAIRAAIEEGALPTPGRPIFPSRGLISFDSGDITFVRGEKESAVMLTGGVRALYRESPGGRFVELTAQRGVVFLPPGPITGLVNLQAGDILGIYLEGAVTVSDGSYTVRTPHVFYDLAGDRAVMLDAVLWSYDRRRRMPLYVRAEAIRQTAADSFIANEARVARTAFARPHISIGTREVTLVRTPGADEPGSTDGGFTADAKDITLRLNDTPLLYWPRFIGDPGEAPLKRFAIDSSDGNGVAVKTTWRADTLLGVDMPDGLTVDLLLDGYFKRGAGLGLEARWQTPTLDGSALAYWLPHDTGEDRLRTGAKRDFDGESRGLLAIEQRFDFTRGWNAWLDVSAISDSTFVDGLFEPLGYQRRDFTTGGAFTRTLDNTQIGIEARGSFQNFIANENTLQTPGYTTERLPEIRAVRIADDLLPGVAPGALTSYSEFSAGSYRLNFSETSAGTLGYRNNTLAQRAFGINADESIADRLRAQGLSESPVTRIDARQEFQLKGRVGEIEITPFVIGRITWYDTKFEDYSPDETDSTRLWGAIGTTISTTLSRVDNTVQSGLLDLNRLRHIIEPSVTVMYADTTISRLDLPVYDDAVERLVEGGIIRFALDQTFQTQRGGPGRWHSVDVLTIESELVFTFDNDEEAPIGRFFDFRPELSRTSDYARASAAWRATNSLALVGETIYDFNTNKQARSSIGMLIDHSPVASTSIELRYIEPIDSTSLDAVTSYSLGDKYTVFGSTSYDFDNNDFRRFSAEIRREFAEVFVGVGLSYDNIQGTTSFGFILQPKGFGRGAALRGIGAGSPIGG